MGQLNWLFQLLLFYFVQYYQMVACSSSLYSFSSSTVHNLCHHDQRSALLQFKHMFIIDNSTGASQYCDYYRGYPSYPKTVSWNESATDCCLWDEVTCDALTGHVIGLDLSCSQLSGTIHPNSTLFQLSQLRRLNLAFNDFNFSTIPSAFGRFASLTHLNLSFSNFSGLIPSEISHQSKLVSLDLSSFYGDLRLEPQNFRMLLKNLTQVQELCLSYVNISSVVPNSLTNMSFLTSLDLSWTGLRGNLPHNIFHLPNLQQLSLGDNTDLTVNLPKVNQSIISSLRKLNLRNAILSRELLDSIGFLKSLNYLDLSRMILSRQLPDSVVGSIPRSIGNLTQITYLSLEGNYLNGQVPSTLSNLRQLNHLSLSGNHLEGQIPDCFAKLARLETLYLSGNNFNGPIPHSVANLTQLVDLGISNNALTGPIPSEIGELRNLQYLSLYNNLLNGTLPSWLFTLPFLVDLDLGFNRLTGQIQFQNKSALRSVYLDQNELHGPIPRSVSNLVNLTRLFLSSNNLSGVLAIDIFPNLENLEGLELSHNRLSVSTSSNTNTTLPKLRDLELSSCKIEEFPGFLKSSANLTYLDLSNNEIRGKIPEWFGVIGKDSLYQLNLSYNNLTHIELLGWKNLQILDLRFNSLEGPLPVPPPNFFTSVFSISHNKLSGEIPSSICNLSSLRILDLSHNNLSGAIPHCFGNFSIDLFVLDLRSNGFQGNIALTFAKGNNLQNLHLNGNQFEGPLPRSLINCRNLEILDLGNNKINDTFPKWLGTLPELQVLVLRSNSFHGPIDTSKLNVSFPKLRIVDLSHNKFTGHLPQRYFKEFIAMKNTTMPNEKYMGYGISYYQFSVALVYKGFEIELVRILTIFSTIDLSSNNFSGGIPNVIGMLDSLLLLNLSHNRLDGHIPPSLGELKNLDSLDLSSNQLIGKIPNQLTSLRFLGTLNLSWNHLDGRIPQGKQFDTFENNSYAGNSGLCGLPLSKECEDNQATVQSSRVYHPEDDSDFASGFTWKVVVIGYGCGTALGLIMGYVMLMTGRPKWFARIAEGKQQRKVTSIKSVSYRRGGRKKH